MTAGRGRSRAKSLMLGWLYADLLLVLFIAAMGTPHAPATPEPVSAIPEPTETMADGLDPRPIVFSVPVDRDRLVRGDRAVERTFARRASNLLEAAIRQRDDGEARVGLAITFGFDASLGTAQQVARDANRIARREEPNLFRDAVVKNYGSLRPDDRVSFEIYLYR